MVEKGVGHPNKLLYIRGKIKNGVIRRNNEKGLDRNPAPF